MDNKYEKLWVFCPVCGRRTRTSVLKKTTLINFPLYCHWCRSETIISLFNQKVYVEKMDK